MLKKSNPINHEKARIELSKSIKTKYHDCFMALGSIDGVPIKRQPCSEDNFPKAPSKLAHNLHMKS